MKISVKKTQRMGSRTYSVQAFIKRVTITLTGLFAVFSTVVFLLVYLPLTVELEKSLIDNFDQLSFIRYASLQNSINRGLEGARSLSSRTMIRNAVLEYETGEIDMGELIAYTQPKYTDGAKALEYLIIAERSIGGATIAAYTPADYEGEPCAGGGHPVQSNEISSTLCLTGEHAYYVVLSPILSEARVLGYDRLVFDLSEQIYMLCTNTIKSELISHGEFGNLSSGADMVQSSEASSLFYKEGFYYQAFHMQDSTHFISKQSASSLLDPVYRLGRQTLLVGMGILLAFTAAVYLFVIRYAKNELVSLEDSRRSLKEAMSEANMDSLTKAGCRRFGEEFLTSAFERFQEDARSPAVLLFDIDSLKQINDTYGHCLGDRVIRSIAEAVQTSIRSGDMLLRWGGDEFIGIFGGLSKENVMPFAEKLLNTVSNLTIETEGELIRPTISIGISYFNEEDRSFIDAINRADRAMYQSKTEGRNRVYEM